MPVALKYMCTYLKNSSKVRLGREGYKHIHILQNVLIDKFIDPLLNERTFYRDVMSQSELKTI